MTKMFHMSDLELLNYYLGIEVEQGSRDITLCQSAYAKMLLEQSGMSVCKGVQASMEERLKLSKDSTTTKVDATQYQSIVSGLRYLTHTRPNISFVVGYVRRFMEDHLAAVKHLLHYVAGTSRYSLIYPRRGMAALELTGSSTVTWRTTSMEGRAPPACCSSSAIVPSPGSPRSRRSSRCPPARLSTSRWQRQAAREFGWRAGQQIRHHIG
jgi:hypothetical protein